MGGFIIGSVYFGSKTNPSPHLAIASTDTHLALDLQNELQLQQAGGAQSNASSRPRMIVDIMDIRPEDAQETRDILDGELDSGDLDGYLWITSTGTPADPQPARPSFAFMPRSGDKEYLKGTLAAALGPVLLREQLEHRGIASNEVSGLLRPVQIRTIQVPHREDRESAEVSITVLFFLMYMVIMLYGMNVARSIIEEKTSRVFEVMLATIRPEEMMAGKIVGVGSVGLTQVGIWIAVPLILARCAIAANLGGQSYHLALSGAQIAYFFVYFILGYAFYSSIAAALGAMTNSEQELQQLNMFLVLPLVVCFATLKSVLTSPDSTLSRSLALIPPFTPLLMYLRVSLGHPAAWEIVLSLLLMLASIYAIILLTSRIYRIGVLMYGKRPNLRELLRWLKYS
jgi:ABC-2 type transport system permease protein